MRGCITRIPGDTCYSISVFIWDERLRPGSVDRVRGRRDGDLRYPARFTTAISSPPSRNNDAICRAFISLLLCLQQQDGRLSLANNIWDAIGWNYWSGGASAASMQHRWLLDRSIDPYLGWLTHPSLESSWTNAISESSRIISNHLESSWIISNHRESSWIILDHLESSWIVLTILNNFKTSWIIWIILNRFRSSWIISESSRILLNPLKSSWIILNHLESS